VVVIATVVVETVEVEDIVVVEVPAKVVVDAAEVDEDPIEFVEAGVEVEAIVVAEDAVEIDVVDKDVDVAEEEVGFEVDWVEVAVDEVGGTEEIDDVVDWVVAEDVGALVLMELDVEEGDVDSFSLLVPMLEASVGELFSIADVVGWGGSCSSFVSGWSFKGGEVVCNVISKDSDEVGRSTWVDVAADTVLSIRSTASIDDLEEIASVANTVAVDFVSFGFGVRVWDFRRALVKF
jgi:hypothetical protein